MNEDLSACWTQFYLEEFPVRRLFCELFGVENLEFVVCVISAAVYLLNCLTLFIDNLKLCTMPMILG